jgi:hypothetical protein
MATRTQEERQHGDAAATGCNQCLTGLLQVGWHQLQVCQGHCQLWPQRTNA